MALVVQTEYETTTLRELDFGRVSNQHWLLWAGFRVRVSESTTIDIALAEDLSSFTLPDFSAYLAISYHLGALDEVLP